MFQPSTYYKSTWLDPADAKKQFKSRELKIRGMNLRFYSLKLLLSFNKQVCASFTNRTLFFNCKSRQWKQAAIRTSPHRSEKENMNLLVYLWVICKDFWFCV